MKNPVLSISFTGSYQNVSIVAVTVSAFAKTFGFDETSTSRVELSFAEATNNVVQHAYGDSQDKRIEVNISFEEGALTITISDSGIAMDQKAFETDYDWDNLDPEQESTWNESGRGMQIIKDMMDSVEYHSINDINTLQLKKYL
ncbi:hypothetical protein A9Q99_00440 [Gammaproteobacteria bacterium 45_16_T64]|nr:hypothetical protein A9Q99_00440 [Gammaproteobacteria bacterium 45_16_T64]